MQNHTEHATLHVPIEIPSHKEINRFVDNSYGSDMDIIHSNMNMTHADDLRCENTPELDEIQTLSMDVVELFHQ